MKKKLLFLAATALLVVNVIFLVQAQGEACVQNSDCMKGNTCIHNTCAVVSSGLFWKEAMVRCKVTKTSGGTYSITVIGTGFSFTTDQNQISYEVLKEVCVDGWSYCAFQHWV